MVKLSDRLQRLADEVQPGETVADIGTDHGLLPIFLCENNIAQKVILCDINEGPLEKARQNIRDSGVHCLEDLRRGDGLAPLAAGEAEVIIIAGMGGLLIAQILAEGIEKAKSCRRLVLQPRNAPEKLRRWLIQNGFSICRESLVAEGKYICEIITAEPSGTECRDEYREKSKLSPLDLEISPLLFQQRDRLLPSFIERKIQIEQRLMEKIQMGSGREDHERILEARKRLELLEGMWKKAREQS